MPMNDHRQRVAAERRDRMRSRLLTSAMRLVAEKGIAGTSIDAVISAAEVSRGTFYKYYPSPDALVNDLAVEVANELIRMAEPVVLGIEDPAERVSTGIRVVARLANEHPLAAAFLVRLGWPDARSPNLLLDFLKRDLIEGIRLERFAPMPIALALNIVTGATLGATHRMLAPECEPDFAEQSSAAALRGLGLSVKSAERIANRPLKPMHTLPFGVLTSTLDTSVPAEQHTTAAQPSTRRRKLA